MHALRLGQRFAAAVALSLALLLVGAVGLGVGIQHGDIRPPHLDAWFAGLHIVAYSTDPTQCRSYLPCHGSSRNYYLVWMFCKGAPGTVCENGYRILTMPLRH